MTFQNVPVLEGFTPAKVYILFRAGAVTGCDVAPIFGASRPQKKKQLIWMGNEKKPENGGGIRKSR